MAAAAGCHGPTSILLTIQLAPHRLGPVAVAAYSYLSLVPIIQPPMMRMMTTRHGWAIDMPQAIPVSQTAPILKEIRRRRRFPQQIRASGIPLSSGA